MTRVFVTACLAAVLCSSLAAQCVISSALTTNNGLAGNTFDVTNLTAQTVRITQMDVNIDAGTFDIEVWTVTGSAATVLNNGAAWTQVDVVTGVAGAGVNLFTTLPVFCSPIDIPAGGTIGIYYFSRTGSPVNYTSGTAAGATSIQDGTLQIFEGWGSPINFTGSPISGRIPSVGLHYVCPGPPGPPPAADYQVNTARASMTLDGAAGNACSPAVVNQSIFNCAPIIPVASTLVFSTANIGLPWDLVLSPVAAVPASSPFGLALPGPAYVNLNLGAPLSFLNGIFASNFPGGGFPGITSATLSFAFSASSQTDFTLQGVTIDPTQAGGVALTGAAEYHANLVNTATSVAGPTTDTSAVNVNVTAPGSCWAPGGIPFYGTSYPQFWMSSNGRVLFVGTDTDASATVAESLTDNPFVGYWCDLNPALGGSITASNPSPGIIRVNYVNVPFAGEAATANTFGVEFDTVNGNVTIDGLLGIQANPQTTLTVNDAAWLGITRGNTGATNGLGATTFSAGGSAMAGNGTDVWYDFYAQVAAGAGLVPSLVPGTLNAILFTPSGGFAPNYDWTGF